MKGLPNFTHCYLCFGVLVSLSRSMWNERCFLLRYLVGLAWRTCICARKKITSTKQNKRKNIAKCVQFSWSLLLSIHVIQFLLVGADLCPIQMTPPESLSLRYDKKTFASPILSFVPSFYADLRFWIVKSRMAGTPLTGRNVTIMNCTVKLKPENVQLALQHGCNTSWIAMFHALLPMNQDCPGAPLVGLI